MSNTGHRAKNGSLLWLVFEMSLTGSCVGGSVPSVMLPGIISKVTGS